MQNVLKIGCLFQMSLYLFMCALFNDSINSADYIMSNDEMIVIH
jgi:hypothetical protein